MLEEKLKEMGLKQDVIDLCLESDYIAEKITLAMNAESRALAMLLKNLMDENPDMTEQEIFEKLDDPKEARIHDLLLLQAHIDLIRFEQQQSKSRLQ